MTPNNPLPAPLDLDALEIKAHNATRGPWHYEGRPTWWAMRKGEPAIDYVYGPTDVPILECIYSEDDAGFIAACDPDTVLELIRLARLAPSTVTGYENDGIPRAKEGGAPE